MQYTLPSQTHPTLLQPKVTLALLRLLVSARAHRAVPIILSTTMSLEGARGLSIPDLLHLLNEKVLLEYNRIRETALAPVVFDASMRSEVRTPGLFNTHS